MRIGGFSYGDEVRPVLRNPVETNNIHTQKNHITMSETSSTHQSTNVHTEEEAGPLQGRWYRPERSERLPLASEPGLAGWTEAQKVKGGQ